MPPSPREDLKAQKTLTKRFTLSPFKGASGARTWNPWIQDLFLLYNISVSQKKAIGEEFCYKLRSRIM